MLINVVQLLYRELFYREINLETDEKGKRFYQSGTPNKSLESSKARFEEVDCRFGGGGMATFIWMNK